MNAVPIVHVSVNNKKLFGYEYSDHWIILLAPRDSVSTNSTRRGCSLGDQFHLAGSSWYPYLPPNGFDTCTVCTCDPISLDVKCPHVQCPPLPCSDKVAFRPDKKACCKKCPEVGEIKTISQLPTYLFQFIEQVKPSVAEKKVFDSDFVGDQGAKRDTHKSAEEVLANGGCKVGQAYFDNGQEWHPVITSVGEQKCVNCRCKVSSSQKCKINNYSNPFFTFSRMAK